MQAGLPTAAMALEVSSVDVQLRRAGNLLDLNRADEAIEILEPLAEQCAGDEIILQLYFGALMVVGRLGDGWRVCERLSRQVWAGKGAPAITGVRWSGELLSGRSVVAYSDQGLGDAIQNVRFVPRLKDAGVEVSIACPASLARLFRSAFPGIPVALTTDEVKADLIIPMCSLACALGLKDETELWSEAPYLRAPTTTTDRHSGAFRVGLAWAGNPCHWRDTMRTLRPAQLLPILNVQGATFFPLQLPVVEGPPPFPVDPARWSDHRHRIGDFLDTAELVAQLDLVITVDTSIAHLAGALGVPTWIMLPYVPDGRWQLGRSDSPWYPSVRLWRQAAPEDWETVIEQVALELKSTVRGRQRDPSEADRSTGVPALAAPPCKCCGGKARWFGAVSADYSMCVHTIADRGEGSFDYWRCESCQFLFCTHFDPWSDERMRTDLYNDEFYQLDDGWILRPQYNAQLLDATLAPLKSVARILDYGGGRGVLAENLRQLGFKQAHSYDPFYDQAGRPTEAAHIVTSFEVMEHALDPHAMLADVESLLAPGGVFIFSTLVQPEDIEEMGLVWWYARPRVGHVSLHSRLSLQHCAARRGWSFESFAPHLHAMYTIRHWWVGRFAEIARRSYLIDAPSANAPRSSS